MSKTLRYLNRAFLVALALFTIGAFVSINSLTRDLASAQTEFRDNLTSSAFQADYELLIR